MKMSSGWMYMLKILFVHIKRQGRMLFAEHLHESAFQKEIRQIGFCLIGPLLFHPIREF